eukprot:UN05368
MQKTKKYAENKENHVFTIDNTNALKNVHNFFLVIRIWLQNVFGLIKVIKSTPKTFLRHYRGR